ncbi:hypothetical protein IKE98_02325 [Candidatus Saccharibacteria bacterium]|nr:hypothetical protein [Candidatus Saccharibacteria bacterium]
MNLRIANMWAKYSCPEWNKIRILRKFCRLRYQKTAERYWMSPEGSQLTRRYKAGEVIDTYPKPYCLQGFANWPEKGDKKNYNLISDQSLCVIKYPTSYCAWKIFEETGTWPRKTSSERLDAKRWVQFLQEAGYSKVVDHPSEGHRYVGVNPDIGEWGLVVWLEEKHKKGKVLVSSYVKKRYKKWWVKEKDFTWVLIH